MAVKDLHEAARIVEGAIQALERLVREADPLMRTALRGLPVGVTPDDDQRFDELTKPSGYFAFVEAWVGLRGLAEKSPWLRVEEEELYARVP